MDDRDVEYLSPREDLDADLHARLAGHGVRHVRALADFIPNLGDPAVDGLLAGASGLLAGALLLLAGALFLDAALVVLALLLRGLFLLLLLLRLILLLLLEALLLLLLLLLAFLLLALGPERDLGVGLWRLDLLLRLGLGRLGLGGLRLGRLRLRRLGLRLRRLHRRGLVGLRQLVPELRHHRGGGAALPGHPEDDEREENRVHHDREDDGPHPAGLRALLEGGRLLRLPLHGAGRARRPTRFTLPR